MWKVWFELSLVWKVAFGLSVVLKVVLGLFSWLPDMHVLTVSAISDGLSAVVGPVAPKASSQAFDTETWISAGLSTSGSCRNSISCRTSTSGIAGEFRPPLVCDLKTMEVVGSKATDVTRVGHHGRQTRHWKRQLLRRLPWGEFLTVYPTSGAYRSRSYQVDR